MSGHLPGWRGALETPECACGHPMQSSSCHRQHIGRWRQGFHPKSELLSGHSLVQPHCQQAQCLAAQAKASTQAQWAPPAYMLQALPLQTYLVGATLTGMLLPCRHQHLHRRCGRPAAAARRQPRPAGLGPAAGFGGGAPAAAGRLQRCSARR